MNLRTLMQVGPAKANELFARLAETSDGAVKTREKLFAELKGELELHTSLEEQHLFPVLRRNAETKELVADAVRDNRELRAKLTELEALPKNDPAFPEQLKELQKTFRQHARDGKRELLPEVRFLLAHGLLHLLGYDHGDPVEKREMDAMTRRLVRAVATNFAKAPKSAQESRRRPATTSPTARPKGAKPNRAPAGDMPMSPEMMGKRMDMMEMMMQMMMDREAARPPAAR